MKPENVEASPGVYFCGVYNEIPQQMPHICMINYLNISATCATPCHTAKGNIWALFYIAYPETGQIWIVYATMFNPSVLERVTVIEEQRLCSAVRTLYHARHSSRKCLRTLHLP